MEANAMRESIQQAGRRAVELFAAVFDGPEESRVAPVCDRETVRRLFAGTIGEEGVGIETAVEEFVRLVPPHSMRTPHPLYLGLVNTSPLPGAVIGDLLVSTFNNNGGAFHQGPAMWGAEQAVLGEFARLLGLGDVVGMFLPGGSYANLHGLMLARTAKFPAWARSGPTALEKNPLVYTADASHLSVARGAFAMGLGRDNVVAIPAIGRGTLDPNALSERIRHDRRAGHEPFAVVATAGTTGTGAIDPIGSIADVCRDEDVWLHVDACYGGGAALLDELRGWFAGIDRADSLAVDPHKWFFMPMTAAIAFTRHPQLEAEAFDIPASYIPGDGQLDAFRRSIATSRRSSGMAVWLGLRAHGWNTIRDAVRRDIELTRLLERLLAERGFRALADGELSIACARWEPAGRDAAELDRLQVGIANEVVRRGIAWFATVNHGGETWLRFNILNLHTRERHIRKLTGVVHDVATGMIA